MQHSERTHPTVTREKGEQVHHFLERRRLERHRLNRAEKHIIRSYNTEGEIPEGVISAAVVRGQQ